MDQYISGVFQVLDRRNYSYGDLSYQELWDLFNLITKEYGDYHKNLLHLNSQLEFRNQQIFQLTDELKKVKASILSISEENFKYVSKTKKLSWKERILGKLII